MKHLIFTIIGVLAVLAISISYAPAAVFHHNRAADNGDSCYTPEEISGQHVMETYEKIAAYSGERAEKFKKGITILYPEVKLEEMTWVEIDAYRFTDKEAKVMIRYNVFEKIGENLCAANGGTAPEDEWNAVVTAAGLAPVASQIRLGFNPNGANND